MYDQQKMRKEKGKKSREGNHSVWDICEYIKCVTHQKRPKTTVVIQLWNEGNNIRMRNQTSKNDMYRIINHRAEGKGKNQERKKENQVSIAN